MHNAVAKASPALETIIITNVKAKLSANKSKGGGGEENRWYVTTIGIIRTGNGENGKKEKEKDEKGKVMLRRKINDFEIIGRQSVT